MVKKIGVVKNAGEVPEGVKILAFLLFAGALILLVFGGLMFSLADGVKNMDPTLLSESGFDQVDPWIMILAGVFLVGLGVFEYFLGRGLLSAQNWSKLVVGIVSVLGIISAVVGFSNAGYASGLFGLVVNGAIVWYLFASEDSKKFFR